MGLSRLNLLQTLGVIDRSPVKIDPLTHDAYAAYELRVWKENLENSPHGHPWHTSFHASSFPGAEKSCGRKALYTMLDIPSAEPSPPYLRAAGEQGKAAEQQIVYRWGLAGLTIGGSQPLSPNGNIRQLGFEDEEIWLTGSIDSVLRIPDYPHVLPVDIKSKAKAVIDSMKIGAESYDPVHYAQVQAYVYLCTKFFGQMGWGEMGLLPPEGGVIYYVSRENPRHAHEFFVEADWDFIQRGIENLRDWKDYYLHDYLPPRPKEWKWTEQPCRWCPLKKFACRPDHAAGTTVLSSSKAIEHAQRIRPNYDQTELDRAVKSRWGEKGCEPSYGKFTESASKVLKSRVGEYMFPSTTELTAHA